MNDVKASEIFCLIFLVYAFPDTKTLCYSPSFKAQQH